MPMGGTIRGSLGAALAALVAVMGFGTTPAQTAVEEPNIAVIMLDDLDYWTVRRIVDSDGGLRPSQFPNIAALARRGAFARNFFSNAVSCCPSRTTFLLGTFSSQNKIWSNGEGEYFEPDPGADPPPMGGGYREFARRGHERVSIAALLAGRYRTIGAGKYLNGYRESLIRDEDSRLRCAGGARATMTVPHGWKAWMGLLRDAGSVSNGYSDYEVNRNGCLVRRTSDDPSLFVDDLVRFSLSQIDAARQNEKPFFLYMTPFNVHSVTRGDGLDYRDTWIDPAQRRKFEDVRYFYRCGGDPFFDDEDDVFEGFSDDCSDLYSFNERAKSDGLSDKPAWVSLAQSKRSQAKIDNAFRDRLAALADFDVALGNLVGGLERRGILDETTIFLTSDQGFKLNEHGIRPGKNTPYDEDMHAPLIVAGPGIAATRRFTPMLSMVDLHATVLDLAGIANPEAVGVSFADRLRAGSGEGRDYVYVEGIRGDYSDAPKMGKPMNKFHVVRTATTKFIWTYSLDGEGTRVAGSDQYEMYDLVADPKEMWAAAPSTSDRVVFMSTIAGCMRAQCPPRLGE